MLRILLFITTSLVVMLSGQVVAHPGPIEHMLIGSNSLHLLMHMGMTLLMGVGAFFISRWVIQLLSSNKHTHSKH